MQRIFVIILSMALSFSVDAEETGHRSEGNQNKPEPTIEMGPSLWTDFEVGISEDEGYEPGVVKVEKNSQSKSADTPKQRPAVSGNSTLKMDENAAKDKQAANPETTPLTSYLNCNGKDGWLTTQLGQDGNAISAKFSPTYDASGKEGEAIPTQMLDSSGNKVPLSKNLQKNLTLNDKNNICGPAGGQLKQGDEPGQAGC